MIFEDNICILMKSQISINWKNKTTSLRSQIIHTMSTDKKKRVNELESLQVVFWNHHHLTSHSFNLVIITKSC